MTDWVNIAASLLGLIVAAWLLLETMALRRVAAGGLVAEKISYVVLATLCLAASAIAEWAANFVSGVTLEQTQIAADLLVTVAMVLLGVYFFALRSGMKRFLQSMTGTEMLAQEKATTSASTPSAADAAEAGDAGRG